jgi:glycosyltransferase involved in cell wall biosynthesis
MDFLSKNVPNIEYLGLVDHNEMPVIYNKYTNMFYEPNLNEPFCRSVAEAILCGMKILTSKMNQIGCITEIEKNGINDFREKCSKASLEFWKTV